MMRIAAVSLDQNPDTGFNNDVLDNAIIPWRFLHYPVQSQK